MIIDPPDGKLPMQPWAVEELAGTQPERGYDDPTAHCFPAGVPRSMYVPTAFQIIQTPDYIVILHERMSWRIMPLDGRAHLPDTIRLWQGDSVGHWEGDTLVVDTTNFNGKTWLNEAARLSATPSTWWNDSRRLVPTRSTTRRPSPIRWCTRGRGRSHFR